jgi:hypothetical protein
MIANESNNAVLESELEDPELDAVSGGFFAAFFARWVKASSTGGDINSDGYSDILTVANGANGA